MLTSCCAAADSIVLGVRLRHGRAGEGVIRVMGLVVFSNSKRVHIKTLLLLLYNQSQDAYPCEMRNVHGCCSRCAGCTDVVAAVFVRRAD